MIRRIALAALLAVSTCAAPAYAQECMPRARAIEWLAQNGMVRSSIGLIGANTVIEIYANPQNGRFMIVTFERGIACVFVGGVGFNRDYWGDDT